MQKMNLPKVCSSSVCKAVKDMNSFEHIDETIASLDDGLSKARLPQSMKLYRATRANSSTACATTKPRSITTKHASSN